MLSVSRSRERVACPPSTELDRRYLKHMLRRRVPDFVKHSPVRVSSPVFRAIRAWRIDLSTSEHSLTVRIFTDDTRGDCTYTDLPRLSVNGMRVFETDMDDRSMTYTITREGVLSSPTWRTEVVVLKAVVSEILTSTCARVTHATSQQ